MLEINIGKTLDHSPDCWHNFIISLRNKYQDWYNVGEDAVRKRVDTELKLCGARVENTENSWILYFNTEKDRTVFILKWG